MKQNTEKERRTGHDYKKMYCNNVKSNKDKEH